MNLQAANSLLITSNLQSTPATIISLGYVGLLPGYGRTHIRLTTNPADLDACAVLTVAYEEWYFLNLTQFRNSNASVSYDPEAVFDRSVATLRI